MEGEEVYTKGRKALKRPLVNSALEIEDEFGRVVKLPCDDHVENSALVTGDAASGTNAEVTEGSIFKILAGRKALKCPCEEDVVNCASATTGKNAQVKTKRHCEDLMENLSFASASDASGEVKGKRLCVENPISSSATTTGTKAGVRRPSAYPAGYAFIEYPDANAYSAEIPLEEWVEGDRIVAKIASCCYQDRDPHPKVNSKRRPLKFGVQPPVPDISFRESPLYKAAVASGAKVVVNGCKWKATMKSSRYLY